LLTGDGGALTGRGHRVSRDADGAVGGAVAVQLGEERVLRHVDDHRGPDPNGLIEWDEVAVTVTLPAFVRAAPSWTSDWVVLEMMFRASDAPMPTLSPVATPPGTANVVSVELFREVSETSPPLAATEAPVSIRAWLVSLTMLIATDPATPMSLAPAPEVALAPNRFIGLVPIIPALTVTPWVLIVEAWIVASAEALTRFKATAAPTPTFEVPAAVPQAFAVSPMTGLAG